MIKIDNQLILEYKTSLRKLRESHRAIEKKKYTIEVKDHGRVFEKVVDERTSQDIEDQRNLQSMISDCEYVLYWLENGHEKPYSDDDFRKLSKCKREKLWADMDEAFRYYGVAVTSEDECNQEKTELKEQLLEILSTLSPRELELFKLRHEVMLTEVECAEKMGISEGTIKSMSQRIRNKIDDYFNYGYQIELF